MFFKVSFLTAGPAPHPSAPPSDAGDNPPWNSDDERDFAEQAYSPPDFAEQAYSPPILLNRLTLLQAYSPYRGFTGVLQHI